MRAQKRGVAAAITAAAVMIGAASGASAATTPVSGDSTVTVSGEIVEIQFEEGPAAEHEHGDEHEDRLVRAIEDDSTGALVEVTGTSLPSGTSVVAEVAVPDAIAPAGLELATTATGAGSAAADEAVEAAAATATPLAVASITATAAAPTVAAATAARSVTVAVAGFSGYPADAAYTDEAITKLITDTSNYWSEQSDGNVTFKQAGATTRFTATNTCSTYTSLWNEAATKTGFTTGNGKHLLVLVPSAAYYAGSCSYGLGSIGSSPATGGRVYVADLSWPALAHEFGHNMSLQHANLLDCPAPATDVAQHPSTFAYGTTSCTDVAYGDSIDLMSGSALDDAGSLGAFGAEKLGLLAADEKKTVSTSGVTTANVSPIGGHTGLQSLKVIDPRNLNVYYVEYRADAGRDSWGWGGAGSSDPDGYEYGVRVVKQSATKGSLLLDPTPNGKYDWDPRVAVTPGTTFKSAGGGVEIRTAPAANGTIAVSVSVASASQTHWAVTKETTTVGAAIAARVTSGDDLAFSGRVGSATTATGTVAVKLGSTTVTAALVDGAYTASVPSAGYGTTAVSVTYSGDDTHATSTSSGTVEVDSPSAVSFSPTSAVTVGETQPVEAVVTPTVAGTPVSGTVSAYVDGSLVETKTLDTNRVVFDLPAATVPGDRSVEVRYAGAGHLLPSTNTKAVTSKAAPVAVTPTPEPSPTSSAPAPAPSPEPSSAPSPSPTSSAPVVVTPEPSPSTSTPVVTTPAPAPSPSTSTPVVTTPAPVPTSAPAPAPAPSTSAPAPSTSAPSTSAPAPAPSENPAVTRIAGEDRIATSVTASERLFATTAPTVVIASSATYADSIGGSRLASALGAPLLLTGSNDLSGSVAAEVRRLLVPGSPVYVLGGEKALSPAVAADLRGLNDYRVVRLSGADRYETAALVAGAITNATNDSGPIYVASGVNFPDGLSVSALAAKTGGVVVLSTGDTLSAATRDYLAVHDPSGARTVTVGGAAERSIANESDSIVGADRYETSALIAGEFGTNAPSVGLAAGGDWPDALVGAAAMGKLGGPLLLTDGRTISAPVSGALTGLAARSGYVFGGTSAVNVSAWSALSASF